MPWERLVHRSATEGRLNAAFVAAVLLSVQYEQMRLHRCFGCCWDAAVELATVHASLD